MWLVVNSAFSLLLYYELIKTFQNRTLIEPAPETDKEMSDDEFDLDFVSQASKTVQSNWKKSFDKKVEPKAAATGAGSKSKLASDSAPAHKNKRGKENEIEIKDVEEIVSDEEISITPPGSPRGTTPKNVRGAKMTKKTQKALDQIKTKNIISEKNNSSRRSKGRGTTSLGEEGMLLVSDGEQEVEDTINLKVRWKTDIEK